ncbi:MAG: hypothetical protein WDW36_009688 [Sanguina aurantia]
MTAGWPSLASSSPRGGIGLATESATLTVITFVAGLLLWLYSTMASVSLQSWADDQHAKSLAAKQLKEAAKTAASSSTRQQTSDATTTSKPVPGSTTAVPGGPSPRQLECLLEQVQRQRSGGGGVCGVAPTRAEVEAVLRAGRCSPVTAEDGALCRCVSRPRGSGLAGLGSRQTLMDDAVQM